VSSFQAPVREGEERTITIQTIGDDGDGIAYVDRGFVLIVPNAAPGNEISVTITDVHETFAFARDVQNHG